MAIFYGLSESEKELQKQYPDKINNMEQVPKAFDEIQQELDAIKTDGFFSSIKQWNKYRKINKFQKTQLFYVGALGENKVLQELDDDYHIICGVKI